MDTNSFKILFGIAGIIILLSFFTSCASTTPRPTVITQGAQIKIPDEDKRPKRVKICPFGGQPEKDVVCLEEPRRIHPDTFWKAPPEGAWVWQQKDLQGIYYALVEYPRYIDVLQGIIEDHNRRMGGGDKNGLMGRLKWWE
jgi:hypothetical protein